MKGYVEKIINEYPQMVRERERLRRQLESCEFLSADELINAMSFSHPEGERVQSSNISDKTAKVAMEYQERLDKINNELIGPMLKRYDALDEEILFFEEKINRLPGELSDIMKTLIIHGKSWDSTEHIFCISRFKLSQMRKQAIAILVREYQKREASIIRYLLS